MIHLWAAERDVAGRDVAAVVLADELPAWSEHLHLFHAVMGDVEIAGRVEAHAVGLIVDLTGGRVLHGQVGKELAIGYFAGSGDVVDMDTVFATFGQIE